MRTKSYCSFQTPASEKISVALAGLVSMQRSGAGQPKPKPTDSPTAKKRWSTAGNSPKLAPKDKGSPVTKNQKTTQQNSGSPTRSRWGSDAASGSPPKPASSPLRRRSSSAAPKVDAAASMAISATFLNNLKKLKAIAKSTQNSMAGPATLPPPASDPKWRDKTSKSCRAEIVASCAGVSNAVARVIVLCTAPPGAKWSIDKQAVAAGPVEALCTLLATLPSSPRMLAALANTMAMNQNILASSRKLCDALSDVVKAIEATAGASCADVRPVSGSFVLFYLCCLFVCWWREA